MERSRKRKNDKRRVAREWGLCLLFALEFIDDRGQLFTLFPELVERFEPRREAFDTARELVVGTVEQLSEVDATIQRSSPRWKVHRMDIIDRNILRLATFELMHRSQTPPRVVINEAVELAKRYGAQPTRSFVNGILQQVCIDNEIQLS